uniref:interferon a3-like n=1 Tax=Semicossyphus pulcher TaxID=241346 RepID=UPI0037E97CC0
MFSLTSLLFVLCSVLSPALCCDWLRHFGHLSGESQNVLELMGGPLTEEQGPVPFPYKLYTRMCKAEVETKLVFIRDSLKQIANLYRHENLTSVTWDTDKMDQFRAIIDRQTEELNSCVSTTRRADRKLRNYFRRLKRCTLDRTGGSAACWELIRKETKEHLALLDVLVNSIKAPGGA